MPSRSSSLIRYGIAVALVAAMTGLSFLAPPLRSGSPFTLYILAAVVTGSIFLMRGASFRFSDGSFSLHAPFWITWPRGIGRVLWVWGWFALGSALAVVFQLPHQLAAFLEYRDPEAAGYIAGCVLVVAVLRWTYRPLWPKNPA